MAVEFALVLPLLVMLMFGIFTAGMAYSDHLSVTNAVREGARLGAAIDYGAVGGETWANSVQARVQQVYMNGNSSLSTSQICVQLVREDGTEEARPTDPNSCGTPPTSPDDMPENGCVVKVWVQKPASISLLVSPELSFTIGARSVAYYGRKVTSGCDAS